MAHFMHPGYMQSKAPSSSSSSSASSSSASSANPYYLGSVASSSSGSSGQPQMHASIPTYMHNMYAPQTAASNSSSSSSSSGLSAASSTQYIVQQAFVSPHEGFIQGHGHSTTSSKSSSSGSSASSSSRSSGTTGATKPHLAYMQPGMATNAPSCASSSGSSSRNSSRSSKSASSFGTSAPHAPYMHPGVVNMHPASLEHSEAAAYPSNSGSSHSPYSAPSYGRSASPVAGWQTDRSHAPMHSFPQHDNLQSQASSYSQSSAGLFPPIPGGQYDYDHSQASSFTHSSRTRRGTASAASASSMQSLAAPVLPVHDPEYRSKSSKSSGSSVPSLNIPSESAAKPSVQNHTEPETEYRYMRAKANGEEEMVSVKAAPETSLSETKSKPRKHHRQAEEVPVAGASESNAHYAPAHQAYQNAFHDEHAQTQPEDYVAERFSSHKKRSKHRSHKSYGSHPPTDNMSFVTMSSLSSAPHSEYSELPRHKHRPRHCEYMGPYHGFGSYDSDREQSSSHAKRCKHGKVLRSRYSSREPSYASSASWHGHYRPSTSDYSHSELDSRYSGTSLSSAGISSRSTASPHNHGFNMRDYLRSSGGRSSRHRSRHHRHAPSYSSYNGTDSRGSIHSKSEPMNLPRYRRKSRYQSSRDSDSAESFFGSEKSGYNRARTRGDPRKAAIHINRLIQQRHKQKHFSNRRLKQYDDDETASEGGLTAILPDMVDEVVDTVLKRVKRTHPGASKAYRKSRHYRVHL